MNVRLLNNLMVEYLVTYLTTRARSGHETGQSASALTIFVFVSVE